MTYKETILFLFSQLPMYQRVGKVAFKKDLNNIIELCNYLKEPQEGFKSIHIAGTNGKGSVSHYIASVLQEAGFKVGLYTSPHYKDFRERIKINGELISKKEVVQFVERINPQLKHTEASFFELSVAMAFDHFSNHEVDYAVIETGLGGRLDSTNILKPILSIITNISFDHQSILGESLVEIATEKAGIIKKETPVLIGKYQESIATVFESKAAEVDSELVYANKMINLEREISEREITFVSNDLSVSIDEDALGPYQVENIRTAASAIEVINQIEQLSISDKEVQKGFDNVRTNTNFIGRWELVSEIPKIIADSAHNEAGLISVFNRINQMEYDQLHVVLGIVKDKNINSLLNLFPKDAKYYFAKAKIPRGMDAKQLRDVFNSYGLKGKSYVSVGNAFNAAKRTAGADDLIFVGGSIFTVAEVL